MGSFGWRSAKRPICQGREKGGWPEWTNRGLSVCLADLCHGIHTGSVGGVAVKEGLELGSGKMLVPDIVFQGIVSLLSFGAVDPH